MGREYGVAIVAWIGSIIGVFLVGNHFTNLVVLLDYDTSKELLTTLLELNGFIFPLGGVFATFLIKNAYDVREEFRGITNKVKKIDRLIYSVLSLFYLFFTLSIISIYFSFRCMATRQITPNILGQIFGCVIGSFAVLFLAFFYLTLEIETLGPRPPPMRSR